MNDTDARFVTLANKERLARKTTGAGLLDCDDRADLARLRNYRLTRVREQLVSRDLVGILLYDPTNIRYATSTRNMAVICMHYLMRYAFIATEGPIIVFDYPGSEHLNNLVDLVDETRTATASYHFCTGPNVNEVARQWAAEIVDLVKTYGGGNRRLAVDRCEPLGAIALHEMAVDVQDGQQVMDHARLIKSPDELALMNQSLAVADAAMAKMYAELRPGITENELWSNLHQVNIAQGGEWIETRLLCSGGRTNPWYQECSDRVIRPGELVAFDTDMVGPHGYCCDVSRTWFCGPGRPTDEQRRLYGLAWEQIHHNVDLLGPGLEFRDYSDKAWTVPDSCRERRYDCLIHGVGLVDEFPSVVYAEDFDAIGYEGTFEPGMVICVESYIGEVGANEGVKLEQQILITETGHEVLSVFPFEEELLGRQI